MHAIARRKPAAHGTTHSPAIPRVVNGIRTYSQPQTNGRRTACFKFAAGRIFHASGTSR